MEKERVRSFEQLKVWQESHALALKVFEITPKLPAEQQEGLAMMIEKEAMEVPKSIAAGFVRRGSRNKAHYYNLAQSALESLRYYFILCRDLKYDIPFDDLAYRGDQIARMLEGLVRSMSRGPMGRGRGRDRDRGGRYDEESREGDVEGGGGGADDREDDDFGDV